MIARIVIRNSQIVSATLYRKGQNPTSERCEGDSFEWKNRWSVKLAEFDGLECSSARPGKTTAINRVTYTVKYSGFAELRLVDGNKTQILKAEKVFETPGNFDGVLHLVYNENGHRGAWFVSDEYQAFKDTRNIGWVVRQNPDEFELEMKGLFIESNVHSVEGYSCFDTERRTVFTDGEIVIGTIGDRTVLRVANARWVVLEKRHLQSGRAQRVLFTEENYLELADIPVNNTSRMSAADYYYRTPNYRTDYNNLAEEYVDAAMAMA